MEYCQNEEEIWVAPTSVWWRPCTRREISAHSMPDMSKDISWMPNESFEVEIIGYHGNPHYGDHGKSCFNLNANPFGYMTMTSINLRYSNIQLVSVPLKLEHILQ